MNIKTWITYRVELEDETIIILAFTKNNDLYDDEEFLGFEAHECYDKEENRYVCYFSIDTDDIILKRIERDINHGVTVTEFQVVQFTEQIETLHVGEDYWLGYSEEPENIGKARDLL